MFLQNPFLSHWNLDKIAFLEWHFTFRCENNCLYCYVKDTPGDQNEFKNELNKKQCLVVVDKFAKYLEQENIQGKVLLTGGDPLLREDAWDIIKAFRNRGIPTIILGNPHLVNDEMAKNLIKLGVNYYQLSIDGMEKTHDSIRNRGSFKKTWEAVDVLKRNGFLVGISLTLTARNYLEIRKVIDCCVKHGVNSFRLSRLVLEGKGKNFKNELISPLSYKETIGLTINKIADLANKNIIISLANCDGLRYKAFEMLQNNFLPPRLNYFITTPKGCNTRFITLLPDGKIYVCRKLPIEIGNILDITMEEAFNSPLALKLRNPESYKECRDCQYHQYCCGGCPSITYSLTGNPFGRDPQCWLG